MQIKIAVIFTFFQCTHWTLEYLFHLLFSLITTCAIPLMKKPDDSLCLFEVRKSLKFSKWLLQHKITQQDLINDWKYMKILLAQLV